MGISTTGTSGVSPAAADTAYVNVSGDTMTGPLVLPITQGSAGIIRQVATTTAQKTEIYNTSDSNTTPVNYERLNIGWNGSDGFINVQGGGTGANNRNLTLGVGGNPQWQVVGTTGSWIPIGGSNSLDLGASGTTVRTGYFGTSIQGGRTKTLTESAATGFVTITVANSEVACGRVSYTIIAKDATNTQAVSGELFFSAAATSDGVVTADAVSDQHVLNPRTSGTLTNTMTSTTAANSITLLANAVSSLTQTTLEIRYRVESLGGTFTVTGL